MLLPKPKRSEALMHVSTMLYLSSAFGMLFGGYITDQVSWRLICIPNLAYAAAAIWLLVRYFPDMPVQRSAPDRLARNCSIAVALVSLQVILSPAKSTTGSVLRGSACSHGWERPLLILFGI